jgi:hypothetical protein
MSVFLSRWRRRLPTVGALLIGSSLLVGCRGAAQFSSKEADQIKQGPPKEMPVQARQILEKARQNRPPARSSGQSDSG